MIDAYLYSVVTEFVAEMLDDPRCEYILLDTGEGAVLGSDSSVLYSDVTGKRCACTLNIVGEEYSASVRDCDTDETISMVEGGKGGGGSFGSCSPKSRQNCRRTNDQAIRLGIPEACR